MKLEAVNSKSGVLKIIRPSDVFGYVLDRGENSTGYSTYLLWYGFPATN